MPDLLSVDQLARVIGAFFGKAQPTLFAGAGVGVRAGLPNWDRFLEHLIGVAAQYEEETAALMRVRMRQKQFAEVASLYKRCPTIPVRYDRKLWIVEPVTPAAYPPA